MKPEAQINDNKSDQTLLHCSFPLHRHQLAKHRLLTKNKTRQKDLFGVNQTGGDKELQTAWYQISEEKFDGHRWAEGISGELDEGEI